MNRDDLLTFYLPILITVLVTGAFALRAPDPWAAFRRGLIGCVCLMGTYEFIKQLIDAANYPDPKEADFVWAGLNGLKVGVLMGGLVGLAVGYCARLLIGQKRK
jgi:hypothetical protein